MLSIRKTGAALFATAILGVGFAGPAAAQNNTQNGLVNVYVNNVSVLDNAHIGVAANVAAAICGVKVGPVAVLGTAVDASGETQTVCTIEGQTVTLTQA